ncbi:MAG: dCTP deaminase [Acidilobaceae archaeon]
MILSDRDILTLIKAGDILIEPFDVEIVRENGLDLRLGRGYCRFKPIEKILDPRSPGDPRDFYECGESDEIIVRPKEHLLLHTLEYVKLPDYVAGLVNLRSTWARTGIYVPSTAVDAGFEGQLTIEVIGSSFPVKLYSGDRFLHLVLVKLGTPSARPYRGEYQGQRGVRLPKFFGL